MKTQNIMTLWLLFFADLSVVMSGEYSWNKISYPASVTDTSTYCIIQAFDSSEAFAAGSNGIITHVDVNNGIYSVNHYGNQTLRWICFADRQYGWAVGDDGTIYATTDNGTTWVKQSSGVRTRLNSVFSVDRNTVWIAGDSGTILFTSDGGQSWIDTSITLQKPPESSNDSDCFDIVSIAFSDKTTGCFGGNWRSSELPSIYMTCDSGSHWVGTDIFKSITGELVEIAFNQKKPVVFLKNTNISTDTLTITDNNLPCITDVMININVFSSYNLQQYRCSYHKVFYPSVRKDISSAYFRITNQTIYAVDTVNNGTVWIAGTNGSIFRTIDKGTNWLSINNGKCQVDDLRFVKFIDKSHGFIGGKNGTLLSSDDGGRTWRNMIQPGNVSISYNDIVFNDSLNKGFLAVQKKTYIDTFFLQATSDGGKSWYTDTSFPENISHFIKTDKNNIFGISPNRYYTNIFTHDFSSNRENNWIKLSELSVVDFYPLTPDIFFTIISGDNCEILKSTNSGADYNYKSSVDHADQRYKEFYSITFSNPSTGWVVGDSGLILKSSDSGYTWQRQLSPTTETLKEIRFYNSLFGWTLSSNKIFLTFDGGITWQDKSILTSTKINDFYCSDPENCWAAGDDGLILHLSNQVDKYIHITTPFKNTSYKTGDSMTVRWECLGVNQLSISVSYDNGKSYSVYRAATDNDGEETIRISANAMPSNSCKIRIRDIDETVQDESDNFSIEAGSASVNNLNTIPFKTGCHIAGSKITLALVKDSPVSIKIYTFSGRQISWQKCFKGIKGTRVELLPLSQLPAGSYLVHVNIENNDFTQKIFVYR